jgi:hypothetical protein
MSDKQEMVLLGTRVVEVPSEEYIKETYLPAAQPYMRSKCLSPKKDDIITLTNKDEETEWLVVQAGQKNGEHSEYRCELQKIISYGKNVHVSHEIRWIIILLDENSESRTSAYVDLDIIQFNDVKIVGQVQHVNVCVRVPDLPTKVGLKSD